MDELQAEFDYLAKMPCPCGFQCPHDKRYEELKALLAAHKTEPDRNGSGS